MGITAQTLNLAPRLDSTAKLLLLLSRKEITETQAAVARTLAADIKDWHELVTLADQKFVATYLHKHLSSCASDLAPPEAMGSLRQMSQTTGLAVLRITASMSRFHARCIQPTRTRHAYVKGIALSRQFSLPITQRFCRDIDILIEHEAFHGVLAAAVAHDYKVVMDTDPIKFTTGKADLDFLARYADVVTLLDPHGVFIEVHRQLDKLSVNFDIAQALRDAEDVEVAGLSIKTLTKPLHFVYAAYHHSRHFWSRLHWLADLDAMIRSVDRREALSVATHIGIQPAISAAFEFNDLAMSPNTWSPENLSSTQGGEYLRACLVNLRGGLEIEEALRENMTLSDFMADWQISQNQYGRLWFNSWLRRLRPSVTQYNHRQYPRMLHWLYSLENGLALSKNAIMLSVRALTRTGRRPRA